MAKIDIQQWGNFKVKDVFETNLIGKTLQVPTGAMVERKNLREGDIPRVTVSNFNNGITGYYADIDDSNYRVYENFISVSFLGTVFYQPSRASLDMKVHCLKLKGRSYNINIAEYLVTVVRNAIKNFMYADQLSSTVLPDLEIQLPVCQNGEPDWEYMDTYMSEVLRESEASLENLKQASTLKRQIDITRWKKFKLTDIFNMNNTKSIVQKSIEPNSGKTPYVTAQAGNNGVLTYIVCPNEWKDDGNCIMIGGKTLTFSYQKEPFCSNDSHNIVLYLKDKSHETEISYLFLIVVLRKALSQKYSWGDSISMTRIKEDTFQLPVKQDGNPDWEYMDAYMSKVLRESEGNLENLIHGVGD